MKSQTSSGNKCTGPPLCRGGLLAGPHPWRPATLHFVSNLHFVHIEFFLLKHDNLFKWARSSIINNGLTLFIVCCCSVHLLCMLLFSCLGLIAVSARPQQGFAQHYYFGKEGMSPPRPSTHIYIYIHVCVYIYIYTHVSMYTHTHIHVIIHSSYPSLVYHIILYYSISYIIYIYICVCMYIYIYIYIHIHTHIHVIIHSLYHILV